MNEKVKLKDGTEVNIRRLEPGDVDRSFAFFLALPEEDRAYLRVDVTDREIVQQRIDAMESDKKIRLVAVIDDQIVADGSLELGLEGWEKHVAELRLIVAHPYQRKGLGVLMARKLHMLAASNNVEEIIVKFMEPQIGARKMIEKLGFHQDAVLHEYVKDIRGVKQNLVLMRCDLEALWKELEHYIAGFDWRRTR